jgi:acyl-CoA dehydrogenase
VSSSQFTSSDPSDADALRDTIRAFVRRELYPLEATHLAGQAPPEALMPAQEKARRSGLWLLDTPEEYGGAGLGLRMMCVVWQELYKAAVLPARNTTVLGPSAGPMLYAGTEEQKARYLGPVLEMDKATAFAQTEPAAGSDPAGMKTRAVFEAGQWLLNGDKQFITGAKEADFLQVVAVTEPGTGSSRPQFTVFLVDVDKPGVEIGRCDETLDGEQTWEVHLRDVQLGPEQVLGEVGAGFRLAQQWLIKGRLHQAAKAIAFGERALAMSVRHAQEREAFGRRIIDHEAIGFMLADSHMELEMVKLLTQDCATKADQGRDVRYAAATAKIMAVETGCRILDRAVQVHGGMGLMKDLPLAKWYWDLRSLRITEGTTEVMRNFIVRSLPARYADL